MMGNTKVGKTTCGHYLTQKSSLIGAEDQYGENIYRVEGGREYESAKIG